VVDLQPPFSPERFIDAITACEEAGMEVIIIDSSSHEWSGVVGCLEINENIATARYKGNTWSAWNETTPRHDKFVNKVLQARAHVITCTRSKMETVMGEGKKVHKVGMKDIQRDGWEYELTVSLTIDRDTHLAVASKDRTNLFEGKDAFIITEKTGKMIKDWCETGVMESVGQHQNIDNINGSIYDIAADNWKTKRILTDDQFQSAIVKIQDGECIKGSTVTVYDWVKTECQLTEAQQNTFNLLNTTDNGTD
jgi:hypothetical protein